MLDSIMCKLLLFLTIWQCIALKGCLQTLASGNILQYHGPSGVNAWALFRKTTGSTISRRDFIHELALDLTEAAKSANMKPPTSVASASSEQFSKRVNCQVKLACNRNRTVAGYGICKHPTCDKCIENSLSSCKDNGKNNDDNS